MTAMATRVMPSPATRRWTINASLLLFLLVAGAGVAVVLALVHPRASVVSGAPLVAHLTGLLTGYGVAVMLLIMSRSPMIEHGVGADRLARWHSRLGPVIIIGAAVHAVAAVQAVAGLSGAATVSAWAEVLGWPGLTAAAVGTALLILVGVASVRGLRRLLTHERWHLIHLATYLAAGLAFSHQLAGPNLVGSLWVQVGWSLLYAYAFATVLRYRVIQPLHQLWRHRVRVEQVVRESDDVVSVVMRGGHLDELRAVPGQFFRWRILTREMWRTAYPLSLSAAPTNDRLRITVKALGDGTRAFAHLRPGTMVLAEGPYGRLTASARRRTRVLLIAGGVGITPMRALFEALDVPAGDLTLVYRAAREQDLVFRAELDAIAARKGARVIYLVGSSDQPANLLNAYTLQTMVGGLDEHDIYLCAPPRMAAKIRSSLVHSGHSPRRLHEERFGA